MRLLHISLTSRPVVLKVGGITPLRVILRGKGVKKNKGDDRGRNNTEGAKMINH